jgi:hypothetical protein
LIKKMTRKFIKFIKNSTKTTYYTNILKELGIEIKKKTLNKYYDNLTNIVKKIFAHMSSTLTGLIDDVMPIITTINAKKPTDNSDEDIMNLVAQVVNINELVGYPNDPIERFTYKICDPNCRCKYMNISEYDNFLFTYQRKISNMRKSPWNNDSTYEITYNTEGDYTYSNGTYSGYTYSNRTYSGYTYSNNTVPVISEATVNKIKELGYQVVDNSKTSNILELFRTHQFVNNHAELVDLIIDRMETDRCVPGSFNKYDEIDLGTAYMLLAMSNDINITYDQFLSRLKETKVLPNEYPVEFILRIISRIFGVVIYLYDSKFKSMTIDNVIDYLYQQHVTIYQASFMTFYLLVPLNEEFNPIGTCQPGQLNQSNQPNQSVQYTIQQSSNIVEV